MADPFKSTIERYDRVIGLIIENLEKLFRDLLEDKRKHAELRNTIVHRFYTEKKEFIANRRSEMERGAAAASHTIPAAQLNQIVSLQAELDNLIAKEMDIERREAIAIKDDPARIDVEIKAVQDLLKYIKDNAGSKDKRRALDTAAMYNQIKDIYNSILTRKEELDLTDKEFKPLQQQIEAKAKEIINLINALMKSIPSTKPTPSPKPSKRRVPSGKGTPPPAKVPTKVREAVEKAQKTLGKEEGYFMRINRFAKEVQAILNSNMDPMTQLRQIRRRFKKIKGLERREQFMASVAKLRRRLEDILKLPSVDPAIKKEIEKLIRELKIFEGETLVKTVQESEDLKKGDISKAREAVKTIARDSAAVVSIEERLKRILGGVWRNVTGTVRGAAGGIVDNIRLQGMMTKQSAISSVRNWASRVGNLVANLRGKIKKGKVTAKDVEEAEGAAAVAPEVEKRINVLVRVANGIRNFDPKKSARIMWLANRLNVLKDGIASRLKNLRKARTPQEAETIAAEVQQEAAQAEEVATEAETELQAAIMLMAQGGHPLAGIREEDLIMPDIVMRPVKQKAIKPRKAERTQRSNKGRPYDRNQARREAEREIREAGY